MFQGEKMIKRIKFTVKCSYLFMNKAMFPNKSLTHPNLDHAILASLICIHEHKHYHQKISYLSIIITFLLHNRINKT